MAAPMTAGRCASVQAPLRPVASRRRLVQRRRSVAVRAGLLDLLRGGSAAPQLATDAEGEELRSWLQADKGLPPQQLAAAAVPGAGRGLVATAAIGKGEALLRLPRPLLITPAVAQQQSCLRELLVATPLPAWSVLALWLAEARAAAERGEGEWRRYVVLLPDAAGCVLEWSEEEVGWLRGSPLADAAADIRSAADASWLEMAPLLADAAQRGLAPPGVFTEGRLRWAFAMLLSRLVRLPSLDADGGGGGGGDSGGGGVEALLPWADLLNHDPACRAFLDWDAGMAAVVLRADRPYRAGEEVHVSYGEKTSGALLLSYGFCPPPGSNPHDGCSLALALAAGDPAFEAKAAALGRRGFAPRQAFPLRMDAAPWELMHYAGLAVAEVGSGSSGGGGSSVADEAEQLAARLFDADAFPAHLQRPALEAVIAACKAAQAAYPASFDADRAELDALQAGQGAAEDGRRRRRSAVLQCLVYERQVLARKLFLLQQELKDLKRMSPRM